MNTEKRIAVIGLGYVGLPLAAAFGNKLRTFGFDINKKRIEELSKGYDRTLEVSEQDLKKSEHLTFHSELHEISEANVYIITVPTPVDSNNRPDLTPLLKASEAVGSIIKEGDYVIYESTVYPGATEEVCIPILEKASNLVFNKDFFCGYSPERINPGDKEHTVTKILKVTSGSTPEAADFINNLYAEIITAGTFKASSIKVAEAAKVIENTQRDINIAFMNELSLLFDKLNIDTSEVLAAAGTKWNFLRFTPGLVGGHCIGVDPYYLTHKAQEVGYHPEIILAGRRLNDTMTEHVASRIIKLMIKKGVKIAGSKILLLGLTFKENCPDIRNTKVTDLIKELEDFGAIVEVYDPWADHEEVKEEYGITLLKELPEDNSYSAAVLAVSHKEFSTVNPANSISSNGIIFDIKSFWERSVVDGRL